MQRKLVTKDWFMNLFSFTQCFFMDSDFDYDDGPCAVIHPVNDNPMAFNMDFPVAGFVVT